MGSLIDLENASCVAAYVLCTYGIPRVEWRGPELIAYAIGGVRAASVDRLMRKPHAEVVCALVAAGIGVALLLIAGGPGLSTDGIARFLRSEAKTLAAFAALFGGGGWWLVHSWRLLWRCGRSRWEHSVFDLGVRTFGVAVALLLIVIGASLGINADVGGTALAPMMLAGAVVSLIFGLPISLHLGHYWGRRCAEVLGVQREPDLEIGDPPLV